MSFNNEIRKRLKQGGWKLTREGAKHELWEHTNGAVLTVPRRMSDTGHRRVNVLKTIERLENDPSR